MDRQFLNIFSFISLYNLNILLILGLTIFLGTVGARIFKKFRIPQVVAYIVIGILLGTMGIGIIKEPIIKAFEPFNLFALGLIGFMIGGELKKELFQKYGKQLFYILISEGLSAFLLVTLIVVLVGNFFFESSKLVWAIGLLLGSIAAATAPAATTDVLWEYKTRGPLTTTVLGIVGMDDGLSLVLFAIASSIAVSLLGKTSAGILAKSFRTLYEIGGSIGLGILGGFALSSIVKKINEEYGILAFSIGIIVLILGIAKLIGVDILLAAMSIGFVVTNYIPRKGKEVFELIDKFTPQFMFYSSLFLVRN
ncbi:MAG: cation:proton antiporter [candidate division WOR-3 bacterium]|nr:cation:proton antiporter [candidate division WOR-3 bacterium]